MVSQFNNKILFKPIFMGETIVLLASIEIVSDIKNFLPGDRVGVARMSKTLWDMENLLRLGWTSSAASRPR